MLLLTKMTMRKLTIEEILTPKPEALFGRVVSQSSESAILHPTGGESAVAMIKQKISRPLGVKLADAGNQYPAGTESLHGFAPQLTWSHYRALMRLESKP